MVARTSVEERVKLITRGLKEVIGLDIIKQILIQKDVRILWSVPTRERFLINDFLPILKIKELMDANCDITILIADYHGFLDNRNTELGPMRHRVVYFSNVICYMLMTIKVDLEKIKFRFGSKYQRSDRYVIDFYKLSALTSVEDALRGSESVVEKLNEPLLSSLFYVNMQALDEEHLGVDAHLGGTDQKESFLHADKYLPQLGYDKRAYLMYPEIGKLPDSGENNIKLDLIDTYVRVKKKLKRLILPEMDTKGVFYEIIEFIIFPILNLKKKSFDVTVNEQLIKKYVDYQEFKKDVESGLLSIINIKSAFFVAYEFIVEPMRIELLCNRRLLTWAYPELNDDPNFF